MNYRLDKNFSWINSFKEADNYRAYWLSKSPEERFASAWYLISCACGFATNDPPHLDKTLFSMSKLG
jgi:hypothetical protein